MKKKNSLLIGFIAISILMCPALTPAATYENCNLPAKSGLIAASAVLTIPYFVAKMGYGFAGTLTALFLMAAHWLVMETPIQLS
jgi:hypothetical protein